MSEIKPALTAEQWAQGFVLDGGHHIYRFTHDGVMVSVQSEDYEAGCATEDMLHAVAAFCLKDQPFGFTREMLQIIRDPTHTEFLHWVDIVGDLVEALLPPRETRERDVCFR